VLKRYAVVLVAVLAIAGCGSSSSSKSTSSSSGGGGGAGALSAETKSAATGDIPDNQNFLTFKSTAPAYSITYPEGWAQTGAGRDVSFRDKNNIVHIVVASGAAPTAASVRDELGRERAKTPSLSAGTPQAIALKGGQAIKVTYTTSSAPNPVTGKRVKLTVDRYELAHGGKLATIDLGTPIGVDNVDAYRMMANSFHWR
jgi:hypothetical protein